MEIVYLVLAVIMIAYGFLVASVGSGTSFFLIWFLIGAGFLFLSLARHLHLWSRIPGKLQRIFLIFLAAGTVAFLTVEGCIISQFRAKGTDGLDYIIVLGAQIRENGPSVVLKYRLDTAIDYLNENPDTLCIVTGKQGYNEPCSEARGMADYLEENGIPEERIILEEQADNTAQNIYYSKAYIKDDASVGIVTNNFHLFRALMLAGKQNLNRVCGIAAPGNVLFLPNNCLREFFAVVKDFLCR